MAKIGDFAFILGYSIATIYDMYSTWHGDAADCCKCISGVCQKAIINEMHTI
jgi:hypothetical protein